ncbi:MAG: hypothetical protein U0174_14170 [Polyangiaceae bacterium]
MRSPLFIAAISTLALRGPCSKEDTAAGAASATATATASAPIASASATAPEKPKEVPFEELVKASKPLTISPADQKAAGGTISAEVCAIEGGPLVNKSGMDVFKSIRAIGDRIFTVESDGAVHAYKIEAGPKCKLSVDKTFGDAGVAKFANKIDRLSADSAGNLWATNGVFASYKVGKDGKQVAECTGRPLGYLFVDPSGKSGIGTFANATVAKVTLSGTTCKTEPWAFQDLSTDDKRKGVLTNAQAVGFVGGTIFLGGKLAKSADPNESNVVLALDASGKEKARLGKTDKDYSSKDRFGWVHAISPCKAGVCVLDSNYRRVTAWKTDGKFVDSVDLSALFNLKYPWIADFDRNKTHTYFVTGQDREVKGVAEGNIYRVTGL